ncbi:LysR family transcriptional regulator [Paludibacterium yongneupense]|uniref:LysR family transcriptional regulator n=1 Tax=Paludibacterium yongneupense TaxID=400061 RepID=UPI0003F5EF26|nr:LysR family transcriptional regulator [Paludibacterium yongneupense]
MNLKLLKTFDTLAECLHFGTAAQRLCLSQPALSKQIRLLEDSLGAPLFERGRHGTTLTAFGRYLHAEAGGLLRQSDAFWLRARQAAQGRIGRLAIGFGLSSIELAPKWVAAFRSRYPDIVIGLDDMSSAEQVAALLSGELQLGFVRLPVPAALRCVALQTDRLALALPASTPDDKAEWTDGALIALLPQRGPGLARQIAHYHEQCCAEPQKVDHYAGDIQTVLALVAAGVGKAIVPMSAQSIAPQQVRLRPLDAADTSWQLGLAWNPALDDRVRDHFVQLVCA